MKVKLLLALMLCILSVSLKAQENKIEIEEKQIIVSPREFQGTIGVTFNLNEEINLRVLVKTKRMRFYLMKVILM